MVCINAMCKSTYNICHVFVFQFQVPYTQFSDVDIVSFSNCVDDGIKKYWWSRGDTFRWGRWRFYNELQNTKAIMP